MRNGVLMLVACGVVGLSVCGCEKKAPSGPATPPPAAPAAAKDGHGHDHGGAVPLGTATIGRFEVKAARGDGKVEAGKEVLIDLAVTGGGGAKVGAVRFWIGTQDAKGSVKAKGEIEDPKHPEGWHGHADVPSPLPEGSKLWVEVEDEKGAAAAGSFDLKT